MSPKKIVALLLILSLCLIVFESCSSSRKMKKKCRDCPEFSQVVKKSIPILKLNEQI